MGNTIREKLEREIESELEKMAEMDDGSEEKRRASEHLRNLYQLLLEEKQRDEASANHLKEEEVEDAHQKQLLIERIIGHVVTLAGAVLPLVFYGRWMNKGLEFEKTGTFTSQTFKGLISRFKTTK